MPESKVSDSSEKGIVPRKRGRPPKSKSSLLNSMLGKNKLETASKKFFALQNNGVSQESSTSSMNNVLNDKNFNGSSDELSTPRKRGRPLKPKSSSEIVELITPPKISRDSLRKSIPSSPMTIQSSDNIAINTSEFVSVLQANRNQSTSLSQYSILSDLKDDDVTTELVNLPKKGRGRPRKLKASSLDISSTEEISDTSSCDAKFDDVLEKSVTALKKGRSSKPQPSSLNSMFTDEKSFHASENLDTLKKRNKALKIKSSSLNISINDEPTNIAPGESTISEEKSNQLKLDFSALTKSPKITELGQNSSHQIDSKNSDKESDELKFYPIFASPSLNKKLNSANEETKSNRSNSNRKLNRIKIFTNSDLTENKTKDLKTVEHITLNTNPLLETHIDPTKISDLNNCIDHDIELNACNVHQMCSDCDSIKVIDQIDVSDRKIQNSQVIFKQKSESKQKTFVAVNSLSSSSHNNSDAECFSDDSVINSNNLKNNKNRIDSGITNTLSRHSLEVEITNSSKVEDGDKNVKEKIKLFLTFTSNTELSVQINTANQSNEKNMNSNSNLCMNKTLISKKSETVTLNDSNASIEIEVLKETELWNSDISKKIETMILNDLSSSDETEVLKDTDISESAPKKSESMTLNDSSTSMEIEVSKETGICGSDISQKFETVHSSTLNEIEVLTQTKLCESDVSKISDSVSQNDSSASLEIEVPKNTELYESNDKKMGKHSVKSKYLKVHETIDCHGMEITDSIDQKDNSKDINLKNNFKSELKQKKKTKKTKCGTTNSKSEIVEPTSYTEVSSRRKSLRNRGVRDSFNYSELDHDVNISEASKSNKCKVSESVIGKNDGYLNDNVNKYSLEADYICLTEVQEKVKNKENDRLFPIFKSNKVSFDEITINLSSNKRKNPGELVIVDDDSNSTSEICHRVKKARNQMNMNNSETYNVESKHNQVMMQTDNDPKSVIKKAYKVDTEIICFPKLSHVNIYTETLPEKIDNFHIIADDIDCGIAPLWNKNESIIDINCAEVIKSLERDYHLYQELENNITQAVSNISANENNENDLLWTDSLQNTVSKGKENEDLINEVKAWLLLWKDRFSKSSKPRGRSQSDSDSYSGSDSDDDFISNSIILYGTPGSGKTSLVFSLADELGFTVLEVNASSHRSGRNISNQLKEALESYHMEGIRIEDALLNSKSDTKKESKRNHFSDESEKSQAKNIECFFNVGSKKTEKKDKSNKKKNIASFFDGSDSKKNKNKKIKEKNTIKDSAKNSDDLFGPINSDKKSCRISSSTIILFDDVDIVFEEDEGFWSTVKGFLRISKKPVIFTVSRNLPIVKNTINSDIQIFNMIPASKDSALETLKTCCKLHSRENTNIDLELLTSPNQTDLRRSILNVQFWSKTAKVLDDNSSFVLSNSHEGHSRLVCFNNFIAGDLNFSANCVRELLFNHLPKYSLNAISDYHRLGYDVLFSNYFSILNILDSIKHKKVWEILLDQNSCNTAKSFSDSQMWKEACEIFKQKKKALKNGSCSKQLFVVSDIVDDFSVADMLKGLSLSKNQCISKSERIKLWTAGLPICNDHISLSYEDILQIVSLIEMYALRKAQNKYVTDKISDDNILLLEHPFMVNDQLFSSKTENDLTCISESLPLSQQMNKTALALDYLSMIKNICKDEETRQTNSGKRSGRFLHYFDSISFLMDRKAF